MTELTKLKRKRTGKRNVVLNSLLPECEAMLLREENSTMRREATVLMEALEETRLEVKQLNKAVLELIESEDDYEKIEDESYKFDIKARKVGAGLKTFVERCSENSSKLEKQSQKISVKLPKINIKSFDGEAIQWRAFIEVFDATVHVQSDIMDIEKMTYLRGVLFQGMPFNQSMVYL